MEALNYDDKEKLEKLIHDLHELISPNVAKKINLPQIERASKRLTQFYDECNECREYTDQLIRCMEELAKLGRVEEIKELANLKRITNNVIAHMQKGHKLVIEGQYMSVFMPVGMSIGTAFGVGFDNLALGMSMGMLIGVTIGILVDDAYRKKGLQL